jgi:hypothetical protein
MNIIVHFRHFPVAMGRWFDWALRDLGHEVWSVGCYDGPNIPWGEGFSYPDYDFPPDYEIPEMDYPLKDVLEQCPFEPDMILQASDTTYLMGKAPCPNVILATDPHAVDYHSRVKSASHYISMQDFYLDEIDFPRKMWVPYGYKEDLHIYKEKKIIYDVVFIGLQYSHRLDILNQLKEEGLNVYCDLGKIYEEYVDIYNQGLVAFNYSSRKDLPARFWEGLAMKRCVVTNDVPDLKKLDFEEGRDYIAYNSPQEAVEKIHYLSTNPEHALWIAEQGYIKLKSHGHTYKDRAKEILEHVFN